MTLSDDVVRDTIARASDALNLVRVLGGHRFTLSDEKILQGEIATALSAAGFVVVREVRLGRGDTIDFLVEGTGIEVKLKESKRAILRQCERYARHEAVKALILVTNTATGFPNVIGMKPVFVVSLGKAWL